MGEQAIRAALDRHWAASNAGDYETEHEIYRDDVVLTYPQSGERIRTRRNVQASRAAHPARRKFEIHRIQGSGDLWVTEYVIAYDDRPYFTVSIMEFRDGKVLSETQYFAEAFPASALRSRWTEKVDEHAHPSAGFGPATASQKETPVNDLPHARIQLSNGDSIPAFGFGTLISDPAVTKTAVTTALQAGFRHLDCAERYRNEREIGEAIRGALNTGVLRRQDLFVTTKLWNNNHRPERVGPALRASLERLGLDYVDLYLIHTPFAFKPGDDQEPRDADGKLIYDDEVTLTDTWRALEEQVDAGACRAIGLSDVGIPQVSEVLDAARILPSVVQVEAHPYLPQWDLLDLCKQRGVVMLAFAPLGHSIKPQILDDPAVVEIARRVAKTPAQVLLAWAVQRGTALLTTSTKPSRIRENLDVSAIPDDAMAQLNGIRTRRRLNFVVDTGLPGFIPQHG